MKKLIFFAMVCLIASLAQAQLKVNTWGQTILGNYSLEDNLDLGIPTLRDTTTTLKLYGYGTHGAGALLSFGDQYYNGFKTVAIGEAGNSDSDQLWLHGLKGFRITMNPTANDVIMSYNPFTDDELTVNVPIRSTGIYVASDSRFKENVEPVEDALSTLNALTSVSYQLIARNAAGINGRSAVSDAGDPSGKMAQVQQEFDQFYANRGDDTRRFGFIAQEVEQVLPELVHTDSDGYKYVDYISVIPLLVNAVQQLQGELAEVKGEQPSGSGPMKSKAVAGTDDIDAALVTPTLLQNTPNPFSEDTHVRYTLPETVQQAGLYIYDMQGKQIKSIPVTERGSSSITIHGNELAAGMYIYALIADGKEIASKRMILTK